MAIINATIEEQNLPKYIIDSPTVAHGNKQHNQASHIKNSLSVPLVHRLHHALYVKLGFSKGVNNSNNEPAVFLPVGLCVSAQVVLFAMSLPEEHRQDGVIQGAGEEHCVDTKYTTYNTGNIVYYNE